LDRLCFAAAAAQRLSLLSSSANAACSRAPAQRLLLGYVQLQSCADAELACGSEQATYLKVQVDLLLR
jgi:hypothetical protein